MSIKRKLDNFIKEYDEFIEVEYILDQIYKFVNENKIKIKISYDDFKISNITNNPFKKLKPKNDNMNYDSYIQTQKLMFTSDLCKLYRCKLDYTCSFNYHKIKINKQIENINLITVKI
jgi:hypothetical protein